MPLSTTDEKKLAEIAEEDERGRKRERGRKERERQRNFLWNPNDFIKCSTEERRRSDRK